MNLNTNGQTIWEEDFTKLAVIANGTRSIKFCYTKSMKNKIFLGYRLWNSPHACHVTKCLYKCLFGTFEIYSIHSIHLI